MHRASFRYTHKHIFFPYKCDTTFIGVKINTQINGPATTEEDVTIDRLGVISP